MRLKNSIDEDELERRLEDLERLADRQRGWARDIAGIDTSSTQENEHEQRDLPRPLPALPDGETPLAFGSDERKGKQRRPF